MAENKTSFVLYSDSKSIIDLLSNEQAGLLLKTLFAYVNDENPIIDDSIKLVFEMIKLQLKRDLKKWERTKEGRSIAGKASAEAKRLAKLNEQTSTNSTNVDFVQQTSTNSTVSVSVSDSVNVNDIYYKELLISESWIEINAKNNRSTPDKVKAYLKRFNNNLIAQGDKKVNKKEFMSHFARWLPLEIAKDIKDKPKNNPLL
jgi:hypothetical protein